MKKNNIGSQYLSKVLPATIYLTDKLNELVSAAQTVGFDEAVYPHSGRTRVDCQIDLKDLVDEVIINLKGIAYTTYRLTKLMHNKNGSTEDKKILENILDKIVFEFGPDDEDDNELEGWAPKAQKVSRLSCGYGSYTDDYWQDALDTHSDRKPIKRKSFTHCQVGQNLLEAVKAIDREEE